MGRRLFLLERAGLEQVLSQSSHINSSDNLLSTYSLSPLPRSLVQYNIQFRLPICLRLCVLPRNTSLNGAPNHFPFALPSFSKNEATIGRMMITLSVIILQHKHLSCTSSHTLSLQAAMRPFQRMSITVNTNGITYLGIPV